MKPPNAIASILIHGLILSPAGKQLSVTLRRQTPPPVVPLSKAGGVPYTRPDGPPIKSPSMLPLPGTRQLSLTAQSRLGEGYCGSVFSTSISRLCLDENLSRGVELQPPKLPELVVKVAHPNRRDLLAKEASFYDEMENIQGIVVPRCYGFFETELDCSWTFVEASEGSHPPSRFLSVLLLERLGGEPPLRKDFDDDER